MALPRWSEAVPEAVRLATRWCEWRPTKGSHLTDRPDRAVSTILTISSSNNSKSLKAVRNLRPTMLQLLRRLLPVTVLPLHRHRRQRRLHHLQRLRQRLHHLRARRLRKASNVGWVLFRSEGGNRAGCLAKLPFKGSTEAHCANRSRSWFKQARSTRSHTLTHIHAEELCEEMVCVA